MKVPTYSLALVSAGIFFLNFAHGTAVCRRQWVYAMLNPYIIVKLHHPPAVYIYSIIVLYQPLAM